MTRPAPRRRSVEQAEHAVKQVQQDRDGISAVTYVRCTCPQKRRASEGRSTGFSLETGRQLSWLGIQIPAQQARAVLEAVRRHDEDHWTAPPLDEARGDLADAASSLEAGAAKLREQAALLAEAASQLDAGAGELRAILSIT